MVAVTTAMVATGASLAYVYFTGAPESTPHPPQAISLPPPGPRHFSPPPDLPLSSKLPVIPDSNFDDLEVEDAYDCDYGPLWECIVNGNGGCEVLEEDLRNCLEKSRQSRRS